MVQKNFYTDGPYCKQSFYVNGVPGKEKGIWRAFSVTVSTDRTLRFRKPQLFRNVEDVLMKIKGREAHASLPSYYFVRPGCHASTK